MNLSSNQTFSFARFRRLFGRHTAEHLPAYAMATAVLAGLLLLFVGFATYSHGDSLATTEQGAFYILFLLMGVIIFTSSIFGQFGEKRQATGALLLPASHFEKYLVAWLYSLPIFLLVFTGLFYLVDAVVLYAGARPGRMPELLDLFASLETVQSVLCLLAMLHAAWLWGAIRFENKHFIKTGFAVLLLLGGLSVVNFQVLKQVVGPELLAAIPFTSLRFTESKQLYTLALSDAQGHWLALVPLVLAGLLWVAAYFRLTEKQL